MEIQKQNVIKAYNGADDNGKLMLETLFPDICFTDERKQRPIMERVKTFEDACEELGLTEQAVTEQWDNARLDMPDEVAYQKLRIICAALNEGWQPQFTEDEERWYPWFLLWTDSELSEKTEEETRPLSDNDTERIRWRICGLRLCVLALRSLVYVCVLRLSPLLKERSVSRLLRTAICGSVG